MFGGGMRYGGPTLCSECGHTLPAYAPETHECDPGARERHLFRKLLPEFDRIEDEIRSWLSTPLGRFSEFYAERRRP